jgi:hypothetical protein
MRDGGYRKGPSRNEKEDAVIALFQLEASQSGYGTTYRLTLGFFIPQVVSIVALLSRLL